MRQMRSGVIVRVSTNTAEMEEMINELNVEGLKIGLEMNMSKTQMMVNQWSDMGEIMNESTAYQHQKQLALEPSL
ncbi:hypothetical protein OSTOST_02111 [Ostertagia ostertagi]